MSDNDMFRKEMRTERKKIWLENERGKEKLSKWRIMEINEKRTEGLGGERSIEGND